MNLPPVDEVRFREAYPFPHVVLDDVFPVEWLHQALEDFPDVEWPHWKQYGDNYQPRKRICSDVDVMPAGLRRLIHYMNGPSMLGWLEELTGIQALIPDPYLEGGGLHCSLSGGTLTPHSDFHTYTRLGLFRRLNAILYLNPDWRNGDGGELGLYWPDDASPKICIEPRLGRLVIFQTDDRSVHGFTDPVRDGTVRRSVATYYYTSGESEHFSGDTNTYWRAHVGGGGLRRVRMAVYRGLLFGSRSLSWLAHRANPNLGRNVKAR